MSFAQQVNNWTINTLYEVNFCSVNISVFHWLNFEEKKTVSIVDIDFREQLQE